VYPARAFFGGLLLGPVAIVLAILGQVAILARVGSRVDTAVLIVVADLVAATVVSVTIEVWSNSRRDHVQRGWDMAALVGHWLIAAFAGFIGWVPTFLLWL
jgi:hypothetical protein